MAWVAVGLLTGAAMAGAADVAVIDMDRVVKAHPKSEINNDILRDQLKELESEKEGMLETLQAKKDAFLEARREAADPALGDAVRAEKEKALADQFKALQELEQEMGQRLMGRQREMGDQKLRMHQMVEKAVRELVADVAAKKKLALVIDKSAVSVGGSSVVVFQQEKLDITDLILEQIEAQRK